MSKVSPSGSADAIEILRAWVDDGKLVVSLNQVWEEPGHWGVFLVDIARHVARSYEQSDGIPEAKSLDDIRELFEAEWERPTDEPEGHIVN